MLCCCVLTQLDISWFLVIMAGVVAYRLKDVKLSKYIKISAFALFIVSFIAYFISMPSSNINQFKLIDPLYNKLAWIFCCWSLAVLISQLVYHHPKSKLSSFIDNSGRRFATFSYSLFLTHYQVLKLYQYNCDKFSSIDIYSITVFIAVCAICVLFAWLFYLLFEKNTVNIQRYVTTRLLMK